MKTKRFTVLSLLTALLMPFMLQAQDEANMKMEFSVEDSVKTFKVTVMAADTVVKETEVKLYVERLFCLFPVGTQSTDESGVATFEFPNDIPANLSGRLKVIAKIEDNDNFANTEVSNEVAWGVPRKKVEDLGRSLAASRGHAPIYLMVFAYAIVIGIWGTMIYVILQLLKIRKISRHLHKA